MNKHFDEIEDSQWLTKQDRDDFARYCYIYEKHIKDRYGDFEWEDDAFTHFCKHRKIQQKGKNMGKKKMNHFCFSTYQPKNTKINDRAHHFLRHIRNAFAHGQIEIKYGKSRQRYYVIKDYYNNKLTMVGYIRSDLLWEMIWLLFQTRK